MPALADRFHVVSPDYPGFGNTDMPDPATWDYTFDHLAAIVDGLLTEIGFTGPMGIYMQDYGGPIGNRLIAAHSRLAAVAGHPERQHLRGGLHRRLGRHPSRPVGRSQPRDRGAARGFLQPDTVKAIYTTGHPDAEPDQPRQLEHGLVLPHPPQRPSGAARPVLRLPHQRRAVPDLAGIAARAASP